MTLKLNRDHPKQPINGWSFTEKQYGTVLKDPSLSGLIERIVNFRKFNMLPAGNPEHELAMQYLTTHPHLVLKNESIEVKEARNYLSIASWLRNAWETPPKLTGDNMEIKERIKICKACKFNDCSTDYDSDSIMRISVLASSIYDKELGQCVVHGWHNMVACKQDSVAQNELQPPTCWAGKKLF